MRHKYIDEAFPTWFIFGEHKDGKVDLSDGDDDVVTRITREDAEKLMKLRDNLQEALYVLLKGYSKPIIKKFNEIVKKYGVKYYQ